MKIFAFIFARCLSFALLMLPFAASAQTFFYKEKNQMESIDLSFLYQDDQSIVLTKPENFSKFH